MKKYFIYYFSDYAIKDIGNDDRYFLDGYIWERSKYVD